MIGLAKRAGKLVTGTDAVITAAASRKKPELVIVSRDASARTKKQLADKCAYYGVEMIEIPAGRESLASYAGKKNSQVSAAALTDRGFANQIIFLTNKAAPHD